MPKQAKIRSHRHRTTLYMAPSLARAVKMVAAETGRPANTLIVEALEALVASHRGGDPLGSDQPADRLGLSADARVPLALRGDLDRLNVRVARLETALLASKSMTGVDEDRPRLCAADVRREARAVIAARGQPVSHRDLLETLERRFVLPGRDASENLRTILVHPKARGFVLVKGRGYALQQED